MSNADDAQSTLQQRNAQATRECCEALGLGIVSPSDLKYLTLALMQAVTAEATLNADFATRIRTLYSSLLPQKATASTRAAGKRSVKVQLTPIGDMDESLIDPYGPPNPFGLQQLYGDEQLALALERYAPARLQGAVPIVQERYPGTKPRSLSKAAIIEYIVTTLTARS